MPADSGDPAFTAQERERSFSGLWRWVGVAAVLIAVLAAQLFLPIGDWIRLFQRWVEGAGSTGVLAFIVVYIIGTVFFLPGSVLTIASGFFFGLALGTAVVSVSATIGASLAFLIARYLARDWVVEISAKYPKFEAIDKAIGQEGWKIVGLLRLSPTIPFTLSNYLYGLTAISFWHHALVTWVGTLPGTVMYVYFGAIGRAGLEAASDSATPNEPRQWLFAFGLVATVIATMIITRVARNAIRKVSDDAGPTS